jgi:hypothetical protein
VPAVLLPIVPVSSPGHHVGGPGPDLLLAPGAAVRLRGARTRDGADMPVPIRMGLGGLNRSERTQGSLAVGPAVLATHVPTVAGQTGG